MTRRATFQIQFTQTDAMPLGVGSVYEQSYAYGVNNPLVYTDPSGLRAAVGGSGRSMEVVSNAISDPCAGKKAPPGYYLDVSKYDGFCKQIRLGFINGERNGKQYEIPAKYCNKSPKCVVPISAAMFIERAEWVMRFFAFERGGLLVVGFGGMLRG